MAKQKDIDSFLTTLNGIDKEHEIFIDSDFDKKARKSIDYKTESHQEPFDLFFSNQLTDKKVHSFIEVVKQLCDSTINKRREKVSPTTLRADRTLYHRAIREYYIGKYLAVYCRDIYNKSSDYSHIAIKLLDITTNEKQTYFDNEKSRLEKITIGEGGVTGKQGRIFFIIENPNMVVKIGQALLNSKASDDRRRFLNMILGIMCLTGRRATEVLLMTVGIASLIPVKPNIALFHGQLKNEQALKPVDNYHIYTLANSRLIANKITELQNMVKNPLINTLPILSNLDFSQYNDNDFVKLDINDRLNRSLGREQKKKGEGNAINELARNAQFGNYLTPTNPDDFKAKQLRAMYVLLAHKYFVHDQNISKELTNFGFQLLGHTKAGAIDHYTNYRIRDVPIG